MLNNFTIMKIWILVNLFVMILDVLYVKTQVIFAKHVVVDLS